MKRLLLITLLVFSLKSFALEISCEENQLNNMIYRSLLSYIDRNNEFISKTYGVHGGITYYICASGLPYCYFIDDFYAKLLQKSEMRKDIVIELSYKGFG